MGDVVDDEAPKEFVLQETLKPRLPSILRVETEVGSDTDSRLAGCPSFEIPVQILASCHCLLWIVTRVVKCRTYPGFELGGILGDLSSDFMVEIVVSFDPTQ